MSVWRFDETSERFSLNVTSRLGPHQQQSSWHVLVCRRAGVIGLVNGQGNEWRQFMELTVPNIPLTCTSASCIYDGLWEHGLIKDTVGSFERLLLVPRGANHWVFYIAESDAATSNEKLIAHRFNQVCEQNERALVCQRHCSCHQNSIIESTIAIHVSMEVVSRCYSMAVLIKSRGYFVRMLKALPRTLEKMVRIKYLEAPPPEHDPRRKFLR